MTRRAWATLVIFSLVLGWAFTGAAKNARLTQAIHEKDKALHESQKREREATKFGLAAMGYHQASEKKYANLLATTRKGQLPRPIGGLK